MRIEKYKWLFFILAFYFILAVNYTLNVPCYESPDEPDHYAYVKYLVNNQRLPFLKEKISTEPSTSIHPPLYYFLGAVIYSPFKAYDHTIDITYNEKFGLVNRNRYFHKSESLAEHFPFYILRLFSILLGMGTIVFGWKIAEECFENNDHLKILSTSMIAFIPQFIYISASINNDNLANLISTVIYWLLIKTAKKGIPAKKDIYLMGIILGCAAITKFTVLFLIPLAVIVLYLIKNSKIEYFKNALVLSLMICLISGWYYLRNFLIYDYALGGNFVIKRSLFSYYFIRPFGDIMILSFFGLFGWMNIVMNKSVYLFYIIFYGTGFIAVMKSIFKKVSFNSNFPKIRNFNWIFLLSILLSLITNIRYNMTNIDFQGRHMLAIIAPLALLAAQGYYFIYLWIKEKKHFILAESTKSLIIILIMIILVSLNVFIVNAYINPSFAGAFI